MLLALLLAAAPAPPVRLWFGGDVSLGAGSAALAPLLPLVQERGAGVVNLEGVVAPPGPHAPRVYNARSSLAAAKALGVKVLGVANNHVRDLGLPGEEATLAAIRAQGLAAAGGAAGVAVLEVDGRRVALSAHDLTAGVPAHLLQELQAARRRGDLLIATFHVTGPESYLPSPVLREAAAVALQAGARAVVAHGSHVVGPIERRGDAVIAWGLGNVAFACDCTEVSDGLLLALQISEPRIDVAVLPIEAGLQGKPARPAPDPGAIFDLLEALQTAPLRRHGAWAELP